MWKQFFFPLDFFFVGSSGKKKTKNNFSFPSNTHFWNMCLINCFLEQSSPCEPNAYPLFHVPKKYKITLNEQYQTGP